MNPLDQLAAEIRACQRCELRATATQPVPGLVIPGSTYFCIGEAPGRQEDESGVPFVGAAGQKLNKLLALGQIDQNDCSIANVCRCRPPHNRTPKKKEIAACVPFLWQELALAKPKYIITLGATPLGLFTDEGITRMHGTQFPYTLPDGAQVMVSPQYHPAAALHNPRLWAVMLDDWQNQAAIVPHDYVVDSLIALAKRPTIDLPLYSLDTETDRAGGIGQWSIAWRDRTGQLNVAPFYGPRPDITFGGTVVYHNAKYDSRELKANGMKPAEQFHDTMLMAYCLGLGRQAPKDDSKFRSGSDMVGGLGLKYLARRHLGMEMLTWAQVKDQPDKTAEYNAADSVATFLLAEKWLPTMPCYYFDIDLPLLPVLMAMEDRGVQIDPTFLVEFAKELDNRLATIDLQGINPHKPADIRHYIYDTLGIKPWKFTDKEKLPSTEAEVLETIDDPLVKRILEYKELYKDKGTYVENYIRGRDAFDRIHPEFKQTSTSTSRLSCARPNLQNVDKEGNMRRLFVAPKGHLVVRADYDQLDYRALAAISQDPVLLEALDIKYFGLPDRKFHAVSAALMGLDYHTAKTVNFGVMFGQQAWSLSQQLHWPITQTKAFMVDYFRRFPGIKRYQDQTTETLKATKTATIPFTGRSRRIDALFVDNWRVQQEGIREGINLPVQGLEAEVVKIAMIALHRKHAAPMVLQVHDELLFYLPEHQALEFAHWLKGYIPTIVEFGGVKFPVAVSIGPNWKDCKEI